MCPLNPLSLRCFENRNAFMKPVLTINELEAFIQVAEAKKFRIAAERSFISQPALSRRIQSAESKLGARLLDRNTRHVALTSSGEELLPIAKRIIFEFNDSLSEMSEFITGLKGNVVVACLPSLAASILPQAMVAFRETHPQVSMTLKPVDARSILDMVLNGYADFGISVPPPVGYELAFDPFPSEDEIVLICSRNDPLASQGVVDWSVFLKRPFITSGQDSSITPIVEKAFRQNNLEFKPQYEVANISVLGMVVAEGLGIAAVPRLSLRLIDTRRLKILCFRGERAIREVGIIKLRRRSFSAATRMFLEVLMTQKSQCHNIS